jgi:hypothetical protein
MREAFLIAFLPHHSSTIQSETITLGATRRDNPDQKSNVRPTP